MRQTSKQNIMLKFFNIPVSWKEEHTKLNYYFKPISKELSSEWRSQGYDHPQNCGLLYDAADGRQFPSYVEDIRSIFPTLNNIQFAYYNMLKMTVMPPHQDHYDTYSRIYNVEKDRIRRILVFLEDWKHGHYFEIDGQQYSNWKAGSCVMWSDEIHAAGNVGIEPRYTLQLTAHV